MTHNSLEAAVPRYVVASRYGKWCVVDTFADCKGVTRLIADRDTAVSVMEAFNFQLNDNCAVCGSLIRKYSK